MITAELQHNPYLLETLVKFNGECPKINSRVEKYKSQLLSDWVKDVPKIFYDEMNGYDFDLFFSGTEHDFLLLKQAFSKRGITNDQVRLFLRNRLENAEIKCGQINSMIDWLRAEKNRQFDFDNFYNNNKELFEETFSCVIVGGMREQKDDTKLKYETVNCVDELSKTNLTDVPIVFVIDESMRSMLGCELEKLLYREDVVKKQLFFCISPMLDREYVVRFIADLDVEDPQIVSGIDDEMIADYVQNYPMVSHVRDVISLIESEIHNMDDLLKEKCKQSSLKNAGVHEQISFFEDVIEKIKKADGHFVDLDNYSYGMEFADFTDALENKIRNWYRKKTKITGEADIDKKATDYEIKLNLDINDFYDQVDNYYFKQKRMIEEEFKKYYSEQPLDKGFALQSFALGTPDKTKINGIKKELVLLKEETLEEKKDFRFLFRSYSEPGELVEVISCSYEKFREKAVELIVPVAKDYIEKCQKKLQNHYTTLANKYHERLCQLYDGQTERKDYLLSQLTEDEKILQMDNDWMVKLKDHMFEIERG